MSEHQWEETFNMGQLCEDFSVLVVDDNEINLMLMEDILDIIDIKMRQWKNMLSN